MLEFWTSGPIWKKSAYNTMWCLIGCATGDLGTIAYFQDCWYSLAYTVYYVARHGQWFDY